MQYAYDPSCQPVVLDRLTGPDADARRLAVNILTRHEPAEALPQLLAPLLEHPDGRHFGPALAAVLAHQPDAKRLAQGLASRWAWPDLAKLLPRYQNPALTDATLEIIRRGRPDEVRPAIVSLIYQQASDATARRRVLKHVSASDPLLRDIAAGYFEWHGTTGERKALERQAKREKDPHVRASLAAALTAIQQRDSQTPPDYPDPPESLAPIYRYQGEPATDEHAAREQWASGLRAAAGYDVAIKTAPPTGHVVNPTAGFASRTSGFGLRIGLTPQHPFSESVHVGDDSDFRSEHATVVAVADGVVRLAQPVQHSWGGLIVIEHTPPQGEPFCSLYGHLATLLSVKPGDTVQAGQKLASLGRSWTRDNGGYQAHLHFAIHQGPFDQGHWITGYLSYDDFDAQQHRWVDPRAFLKTLRDQ